MSRHIEFITTVESADFADRPIPSQKNVPDWYKDIPVTREKNFDFKDGGRPSNLTVKHCVPFYDALTCGYQILLATDIKFKSKEGTIDYRYPTVKVLEHREGPTSIPISSEFLPVEFTWKMLWTPKTPKGYSCLITHPMNRLDLPFFTLSGIVDSDIFYHTPNGNLPFYMKKDFEGIIKKGTPIAHVFPFKRDNWTSSKIDFDKKLVDFRNFKVLSVFKDFYKKFAYVKKVFK